MPSPLVSVPPALLTGLPWIGIPTGNGSGSWLLVHGCLPESATRRDRRVRLRTERNIHASLAAETLSRPFFGTAMTTLEVLRVIDETTCDTRFGGVVHHR